MNGVIKSIGLALAGPVMWGTAALANGYPSSRWGWPHMMPWGWMNWRWGGMFAIGLVGLIIVLAVLFLLFQNRTVLERGSGGSETPLEILQKRFARGDISREEFQRMREDLKR